MKRLVSVAGAVLVLAACGGGGGKEATIAPSMPDLVIAGGESIIVPGTLRTDGITLKAAAWSAAGSPGVPENLSLSNDRCTNVIRDDFAPVAGGGWSTWQCDLVVTAPQLERDATYTLTLTGTDKRDQAHSVTKTLRVTRNPALDPALYAGAAGASFRVQPGQLGALRCFAPDAKWYQWGVVDAGGASIALSAQGGSEVYFTAPVVTVDTPITFECRMAVRERVLTSRVTATVAAATGNTLVLGLTGPRAIPFGRHGYTGTATWLNAQGQVVDGPAPVATWSIPTAPPNGLTINTNGLLSTVTVGTSTAVAGVLPLVIKAAADGRTSEARLDVLVEPVEASAAVAPALAPSAQTVKPGDKVVIKATGGQTHEWAVVRGPAVALGGAGTAQVEFVAPSVSTATDILLRVGVGYRTLSAQTTAVEFVDALVRVVP